MRAFPLISIRDDEHLADALVVIDRQIEQPQGSMAEEAYLGALTDLVATYNRDFSDLPNVASMEHAHTSLLYSCDQGFGRFATASGITRREP